MKTCRFCAEEIKDQASFCPHCRKRQGTHPLTAFIGVILALFTACFIIGLVVANWPREQPAVLQPVFHSTVADFQQPSSVLAKFGKPSSDKTHSVTRTIVYEAELVRLNYVPEAGKKGAAWKLSLIQDQSTYQPISAQEAIARMEGRAKR